MIVELQARGIDITSAIEYLAREVLKRTPAERNALALWQVTKLLRFLKGNRAKDAGDVCCMVSLGGDL